MLLVSPYLFQRFRFCGDLDCPDWVLAEISILSKIVSIKIFAMKLFQVKWWQWSSSLIHMICSIQGPSIRVWRWSSDKLVEKSIAVKKLKRWIVNKRCTTETWWSMKQIVRKVCIYDLWLVMDDLIGKNLEGAFIRVTVTIRNGANYAKLELFVTCFLFDFRHP